VRPSPLDALRADPRRSALILDFDGTVAEIAPRPELVVLPERQRRLLARLLSSYLLVAFVSGRPGAEVARLVGLPQARYVGSHGLELHDRADELASRIAAFRSRIEGIWPIEDKRLSLALHYRESPDPVAARAALAEIEELARAEGFRPIWGRKVLEIRPDVDADKGTAVRTLVETAAAAHGLYAGDDSTDLDGFRGLVESGVRPALRVAVRSSECPQALLDAADVVVDGPRGLRRLLGEL
jgi:trehalose-phosphatase